MLREKREFDDFRREMETALEAVADKYDIKFEIGNIKFNATSMRMELKAFDREFDTNRRRRDFNALCHYYGFTPSDYMRVFSFNGAEYMLIGFKSKARKYHALALQLQDEKTYGFAESSVKKCFASQRD
jgi:hypothetical protein